MTDLLDMLISEGYKKEEVFHWCSDLYVYKTELTTKIIKKWLTENKLSYNLFVSVFRDQITDKPMYDIAFQYHSL